MKSSKYLSAILLCAFVGLAAQSFAELQPLGGARVGSTLEAPELPRFINDKDNIPRTFEQQPPLTPHINDRYPINLQENKCLECHMKQAGKEEAKSVVMSDSHFVDRNGNKLDHPAGSRYFCNQCHVPQIDAEPLVGNDFRSVASE
jgi:cytochrome c-type protein NapB